MQYLTKNLTWDEATHTDTGLPNIPNDIEKKNIEVVAQMFQKIRDKWGKPIKVGSLFRSHAVNEKIGGSKTSAHRHGLAIDISCADKTQNGELWSLIVDMCKAEEIVLDQLIWEFGTSTDPQWIHCGVAFSKVTDKPRKQIMMAVKEAGRTVYKPLSPEIAGRMGA